MRRVLAFVLQLTGGVLVAAATAWGTLALVYSELDVAGLRYALAAAFAAFGFATVLALWLPRWRRRMIFTFAVVFAALVVGWNAIEPSNDRQWQTDVAVLADAHIDGDLVTVRNIRNFTYRTETDYTPGYYDKTFDVRKLVSVDLVAVYWMGPDIAHTFVSFGFEGGDRLAISIETRKEQGEAYSTVKGFFKQFELIYIVADERDVIGVRTNYRKNPPEDVYVYRVKGPLENARRLFLQYMRRVDSLESQPEFYNTLTTNCTTNIWTNTEVNPSHIPFSWKILASGHVPEYLYELGRLDTSLPFPELQRQSLVNARAHAADPAADFSAVIRTGLPGMAP